MKIGIDEQIAEVRREIAMRENTYARLVAKNAMTLEEAGQQTARMGAVLATLEWIKANETTIRRVHQARQAVEQLQREFPGSEIAEDAEADA